MKVAEAQGHRRLRREEDPCARAAPRIILLRYVRLNLVTDFQPLRRRPLHRGDDLVQLQHVPDVNARDAGRQQAAVGVAGEDGPVKPERREVASQGFDGGPPDPVTLLDPLRRGEDAKPLQGRPVDDSPLPPRTDEAGLIGKCLLKGCGCGRLLGVLQPHDRGGDGGDGAVDLLVARVDGCGPPPP